MNIGFYLDSIANEEELKTIATEISKHNLRDANIFYNEIGKINIPLTCGLFHCADMWSFEGTLIVSSVKNLVKANNIVNKFKIFYYYGLEKELNVLEMLGCYEDADGIICNGQDKQKEFKRLTNTNVDAVSKNYDGIFNLRCLQ
tara:strand:+ start:669 stop:1100 length:432 start_codon:yes stop_codon:yes gene_type:complete